MKQLIKQNIVELLAIFLSIVDIFWGIFPVLPLIFILSILSLFRTGVIGGYFLTSYALPILWGSALYTVGITGVATLIQLLLFSLCIYQWAIKKELRFYSFRRGFSFLLLVVVLYAVSSFLSSGGNYAITKLKETTLNGVFTFVAFGLLFSNPGKCDNIRIGLNMILYAFLMLLLSPLLNNGAGPDGLLDFGYLRAQNTMVLEEEKLVIDYQHVGFFATIGLGVILLETMKTKLNNTFLFLCIFLCSIASLYSGARQFIIISFVLLLIWALSSRKSKNASGIIYAIMGVGIVVVMFNFLFGEGGMLNSVKEEGYLSASGRELVMAKGIADFLENPIFGVGYGRFEYFGRYGLYPHNMFVEILCELGIVGLLLLIVIVYKPTRYLLREQKACLYLFIVFFLRSMTSGGLDSNIMLFSFIFAVLSLKGLNFSYHQIPIDYGYKAVPSQTVNKSVFFHKNKDL